MNFMKLYDCVGHEYINLYRAKFILRCIMLHTMELDQNVYNNIHQKQQQRSVCNELHCGKKVIFYKLHKNLILEIVEIRGDN